MHRAKMRRGKAAQAATSSLHQEEEGIKGDAVLILRNASSYNGNSVKQATNHLHHGLLPLQ